MFSSNFYFVLSESCLLAADSQIAHLDSRASPTWGRAMQTEPEIYLSHDRYTRLVDALLNAPACPFAGGVTADQIMLALGEGGDIWPAGSASSLDDGQCSLYVLVSG